MRKRYGILAGTVSALAFGLSQAGAAYAADLVEVAPEAAPPVMARVLSGNIGMYWAYSYGVDNDDATSLEHYHGIGGDAMVDIPLTDQISLQLDFYGNSTIDDTSTSEDYFGGSLFAAHLNYRDPDLYLLGVFGGFGSASMGDSGSSSGQASQYMLGVEGQYHMGDWTFYGQGGYSSARDGEGGSNSDWMDDAWFARGVVRKYFNGGLTKVAGDIMYIAGENSQDDTTIDDIDGWAWGIEAEHVIRSYSTGFITAFARYEGYDFDEDINGGGEDSSFAHVIKAGIKVHFGYQSPMMRDRYGAGVDLPDFSRINGLARGVE